MGIGERGVVRIRGVDVLCFPMPAIYFLGKLIYHLRLLAYLIQQWGQIDIVLFHQVSLVWIKPLRLWRIILLRKRPLFIMDTRDLPDRLPGNWRVNLNVRFHHIVHWLANHLTDAQTAITVKMAEYVHIPGQQLLGTWSSGVDIDKFCIEKKSRSWPGPSEPIQLIYIGSLLAKRNPLPLARAVIKANSEGLCFALSFYGDGAEKEILKDAARQSGGIIHLFDPVPHHKIPVLLGKAHIGVTSLPNPDDKKYEASSPVKLFEYMASGLPILATSNHCHTQVIGTGQYVFWIHEISETGILAALRQIWATRDRFEQLSREAFEASEAFTWRSAAQKLDTALQKWLRL